MILQKQLKDQKAQKGCAVLMEVKTGFVKAIANLSFDSETETYFEAQNHAVGLASEPGSTFKVVSAVAAIKQNDISLFEEFDCENGKYQYYNISVSDHEKYEMLTLPQIIKHSSNIGIVKMVERIGSKKLYETCRDLGFGSKTGINLKGEVNLSPFSFFNIFFM